MGINTSEHYTLIPNDTGKAKCHHCDKIIRLENIRRHVRNVHNVTIGKKAPLFLCSICGKSFKDKYARDTHEKTHSKYVDFVCNTCGRGFTTKTNLRLHELRLHATEEDLIFQCSDCGNKYAVERDLKWHRCIAKKFEKNVDPADLSCEHCNMIFDSNFKLQIHIANSQNCPLNKNTKTFKCTECDARFANEGRLKQHMRKHTEEKPHLCTFCGKEFKFAYRLSYHLNYAHNIKQKITENTSKK